MNLLTETTVNQGLYWHGPLKDIHAYCYCASFLWLHEFHTATSCSVIHQAC